MFGEKRLIFISSTRSRLLIVSTIFLFFFFLHRIASLFNSNSQSNENSFANNELLNVMSSVSDGRIRLAKLERTLLLGPVSMWVAFPSEEKVVPGTSWYQTIWDKHDLDAVRFMDEMISLSPCQQNPDQIFIQIGAHLGIFPLFASYRGCRSIAVEAMPLATNFTKISALINGWNEPKFQAINAAVSHKDGYVLFDTTKISISESSNEEKLHPGIVRVPMLTIDTINQRYGRNLKTGKSDITFMVIDVEGHEQEALLGAKKLIESQSVRMFEIEVWSSHHGKGKILSFPGLELLAANGYKLYSVIRNDERQYAPCEDLSKRLDELTSLVEKYCQGLPLLAGDCLFEIFAVRSDLPPMKRWSTMCSA